MANKYLTPNAFFGQRFETSARLTNRWELLYGFHLILAEF